MITKRVTGSNRCSERSRWALRVTESACGLDHSAEWGWPWKSLWSYSRWPAPSPSWKQVACLKLSQHRSWTVLEYLSSLPVPTAAVRHQSIFISITWGNRYDYSDSHMWRGFLKHCCSHSKIKLSIISYSVWNFSLNSWCCRAKVNVFAMLRGEEILSSRHQNMLRKKKEIICIKQVRQHLSWIIFL